MSRLLPLAAVVAGLVLVYWALLFLGQRSVVFPRPDPTGAPPRPPDARVVWLDTPRGRVEAWYLPPLRGRSGGTPAVGAPLLVFLHGNGELIDYWPAELRPPREWGMGVLLIEYPGYGRSEGRPSERAIAAAVRAAWDWAAACPEVDPARIVAYGRSLGGAAAVLLAESRPAAALVLESAFTGVAAFTGRMGMPRFLLRDPFDNLARVRTLEVPLLLLHGSEDRIVPPDHARALHAAQPAAELVMLPCGHNDCPRPWGVVEAFLRRHGVL